MALDFYPKIGATGLDEWTIHRLAGARSPVADSS